MGVVRTVSVELLGNYVVTNAGVPRIGSNPSTVGLADGGFATAMDDSDGVFVRFSSATGAYISSGFYGGSDPSMARLSSGAVGLVYTTTAGQIAFSRDTASNHLGSLKIGTGSNAEIATNDRAGLFGYAVVWETSNSGIALAIASTNDATSLTQVVVTSSDRQIAHDPSVARLDNGNYVVAWTQYGVAGFDTTYFAVYNSTGALVTAPTFVSSSSEPRTSHPSVAAHGNDFTISFEDNGTGEFNIAMYARSDDGRNVTYRQYDGPAGSHDSDPDTATIGAIHATAFTSNFYDGDDIRGQTLYLGLAEAGTGTVLTEAENLVRIAEDGSQASTYAMPAQGAGQFILGYYDRFGGEVHQQIGRIRETITGDASNQTLSGKYGVAVTIDGGGGDDILYDGSGVDRLFGNIGNDTLIIFDEASSLPVPNNDVYDGGDGVDTIDFSLWYRGLTIDLNITGPQNTGGGFDTIVRIENVIGSGAGADTLTGNDGPNVLDDGGFGFLVSVKDTLIGGGGDDTYIVSDSFDVVTESSASGGVDTVKSRANAFTLPTNVEHLMFIGTGSFTGTGNNLNNKITGGAGEDTLDGKVGTDTMVGGKGSDTYRVDNAGDIIVEGKSEGTADIVLASTSYSLGEGVYVEFLQTNSTAGTAAINLVGNELSQTIVGNAGINTLTDGGGAGDVLKGLGGNDIYRVASAATTIIEGKSEGTADVLLASTSYTLGKGVYVEFLQTNSTAGTAAINLTGNELSQTIVGNAGINSLSDGGGAGDVLKGLGGNDIYRVASAATTIIEGKSEGTADVVLASTSYTLGKGVYVEFLQTNSTAGTASINLTGNELAQTLVGNAGANRLDGKGGADTLTGRDGKDTFVFSTALNLGADTITDFKAVDDTIELSKAVFTALGTGVLSTSAFRANTTGLAGDASDRIIYETDTGKLFYDADGNGTGASGIHFATLTGHPTITNADFVVV